MACCSQYFREAKVKHRLLALQWRWIQVVSSSKMESKQRERVPWSGSKIRGQLWCHQQPFCHGQPNWQEIHHRLRFPWGIPLQCTIIFCTLNTSNLCRSSNLHGWCFQLLSSFLSKYEFCKNSRNLTNILLWSLQVDYLLGKQSSLFATASEVLSSNGETFQKKTRLILMLFIRHARPIIKLDY